MHNSLKPSVISALVLAFAGLGDAFLYIALPLHALELNVPVVWIGLLLSVNRFTRLFANQMFAWLIHNYGFKQITLLAALFSFLSTFSYGIATSLYFWLIARIVWGMCYAALRISATGYALHYKNKGIAIGLNKGLQESGPVIALVAGPFILALTNIQNSFIILSFVSLIAIILAFFLPQLKYNKTPVSQGITLLPSQFSLVTFFSSLLVQGILVIIITRLLNDGTLNTKELAVVAGIYLAYRRICNVLLAPIGGMISEKWGVHKVYIIALLFTISGALLIVTGFIKTGIIITFSFYSILQALSPAMAVEGEHKNLSALATNNTWSDLGAASGVLVAGFVMEVFDPLIILFVPTLLLATSCIFYIKSVFLHQKHLSKWN